MENRSELGQLAQALQEKEILDAKDVLEIVKPDPKP